MLKSNSKKAKQNIMKYIRDCSEEYIVNEYSSEYWDKYNLKNDNELCSCILDIFEAEKHYEIERTWKSYYEIFVEWLQGLPLEFTYYYHPIAVRDLGNILEETEEERSRYSESDAENALSHLIYREIKSNFQKLIGGK